MVGDLVNDQGRKDEAGRPEHFHAGNLERIRDTPPNATATVHSHDAMTMSELARRGFHIVDMTGEIWTMHRAG